MSNRSTPLFSITKKDFRVEYFRAGKKGGQKQDKTSSACRITHLQSGAVGECRSHRSQHQNRKAALERLVVSSPFKKWLRMECAAREQGYQNIEARIDELMEEKNLKIEFL